MNKSLVRHVLSGAAVVILGVMLAVGLCVAAFASETGQTVSELVDPSRTGSITVTIKATDGSVPGGTLNLYRVAEVKADDTGYHFFYTDAFSSAQKPISDNSADLTEGYAEELAGIVSANNVSAYASQPVGADGIVRFENVEVGAYLIIQTGVRENYSAVDPFIVTVPVSVEESTTTASGKERKSVELHYDVDATPKAGAAEFHPTSTPTATPTPADRTTQVVTPVSAQTGDTSRPVLWIVLAAAAALVILGIVFYGRKHGKK